VDWDAWERPPIFRLIQETGAVPEADMRRTFNLGIGLVAVVPSRSVLAVLAMLRRRGERPVLMGEVAGA
jgi:phosphoribosylformylglycinamidine cyclo-ligase